MKETQKAKIERLEAENKALREELNTIYEKYHSLLGNADNIAISSPAYRQLQQDLLVQKERANIQERELAACKRIRYQQAEKLKQFQKLIDEQNTKNPRNAGRKPKLTEGQIQEIKEMRKSGMSVRDIAEVFKCSTGLVCKVSSECS